MSAISKRSSIGLAVAAGTASLFISAAAHAQTDGFWLGPTSGNTGDWGVASNWQDGAIPDGQGHSATHVGGTGAANVNRILRNNTVAGVTVGTIKLTGTTALANLAFQITPNQIVNLNQDGAGSQSASLINDLVMSGGNTHGLFLNVPGGVNVGYYNLQDDLFISNTSNSTRSNGSIAIRGALRGSGNITVENINNDIAAGAVAFSNDESSGPGAGGFAGDIFLNKGAVTFTRGDVFTPVSTKTVTIGAAGKGDVTFAFIGDALGNIENNIAVAANTGGTTMFVSNPTTVGNVTIKTTNTNAANVTLNGDITFDNRATNGSTLIVGDRIFGAGGFTKVGVGAMRVTNTNSYEGGTLVSIGSLAVAHAPEFNNGFGVHAATDGTLGSGDVTVETTATRLEIDTALAAINVIDDTATLSLAGGGTLGTADLGYALLGEGINDTVAGLILGGAAQTASGTYGSTSSTATFQNDEFFFGSGVITLTLPGQPGDYNDDGTVDAADYVVWRKTGINGPTGYGTWRTNFGEPGGSGSVASANTTVPEPATTVLLMCAAASLWLRRRRSE